MNPRPSPTIQQIAAKVGVSASTVSRALRNDRRISAATSKRVKDAAKKVGYRPNPLISVLMAHLRTVNPPEYQSTIAYLDTSSLPSGTREWSSSQQFYESVCDHAAQLGYGIDSFWFHDPEVTPKQLVKILLSRGIRGIIIHYLPEEHGQFHELPIDLSPFAVAALGSKMDVPSIHYACTDHYDMMKLAFEKLHALGYRRIGVAIESYVDNITEGRLLGAYLSAEESLKIENRVPRLFTADFSAETFAQWFHYAQPEAIICIDDQILTWLKEMKVSVPKDVGVVHLDQPSDMPHLSGIRQRHGAVGASAVDLIVGQLHRNERGVPEAPKAVLTGGKWIQGKTVRPGLVPVSAAAKPKDR